MGLPVSGWTTWGGRGFRKLKPGSTHFTYSTLPLQNHGRHLSWHGYFGLACFAQPIHRVMHSAVSMSEHSGVVDTEMKVMLLIISSIQPLSSKHQDFPSMHHEAKKSPGWSIHYPLLWPSSARSLPLQAIFGGKEHDTKCNFVGLTEYNSSDGARRSGDLL